MTTGATVFALMVSSIDHSLVSISSSSNSDGIDNSTVSVTFTSASPYAGRLTVTLANPPLGVPTVATPGLLDVHDAETPFANEVGTSKLPVILDGSLISALKLSYAPCKTASAGSSFPLQETRTRPNAMIAINKNTFFIPFLLLFFYVITRLLVSDKIISFFILSVDVTIKICLICGIISKDLNE